MLLLDNSIPHMFTFYMCTLRVRRLLSVILENSGSLLKWNSTNNAAITDVISNAGSALDTKFVYNLKL